MNTGVTGDLDRAAALYQRACDGGAMDGCTHLGSQYQDTAGVAQDFARAASLFGRACDGGALDACSKLGIMREHGEGISQDPALAADLFFLPALLLVLDRPSPEDAAEDLPSG